jgi:NADPH-dependent glutamate synthase beta subunit-like oxidoreductase
MNENSRDLTRPADLRHDALTGPERERRPVYVDLLPPCNAACPAGENIQAWLGAAQAGDYETAWRTLVADNPLPAVHGRVCYHPCEDHCNRTPIDQAVSIHAVERYLGDRALAEGWQVPSPAPESGRRVLVVGAGPSGLSAAWHLRMAGHAVEIRDAGPVAGGMMHVGIPSYRLPRDVLEAEIARIEAAGVTITLNHKVEDLERERTEGGFDAVFVAVGAHLSKRIDIPARDAGRVMDAVTFLRDVDSGNAPRLGRRIAVYGGGNTAMDAARVARRLGADEALIVYRRDREHMPAHAFEAADAEEEGIRINWLRSIRELDSTRMTVEVMELDENGRPRPTGETETLEADSLILALGQDTDTGFLRAVDGIEFHRDGTVVVDARMMTGHEGIFAGGDMVPSERTATVAVGHGKKAARHIDAWLGGGRYEPAPKHPVVTRDMLRLSLYQGTFAQPEPKRAAALRAEDFGEVVSTITEPEARHEAARCLSCGNCYECDGCLAACPEDAVIKLGPGKRYRFDYTLCTGCATCYEQCPCHAIEMIPEPGIER